MNVQRPSTMNPRLRPLGARGLAAAALAVFLAAGCAGKPPAEQAQAPPAETAPAPEAASAPIDGVVAVTVDGTGFHPDRIAAKVGQPVTLAITRVTDESCGTEIVIPALGIDQKLPLNERVEVTVTPDSAGTIAFACGMNMLKGSIVVE